MAQPQMRKPVECGVPDHMQYLHPVMRKNYGNWKTHDRPRPGVLPTPIRTQPRAGRALGWGGGP